jgi:hypothetical protein
MPDNSVTKVLFFGGYLSTHDDVESWRKSLMSKVPGIEAIVFHYPEMTPAGKPLLRWQQTQWAAEQIAGPGKCLIVGHSSGCLIANTVAAFAHSMGLSFKLIALDGFAPDDKLLALPETEVWGARCGKKQSLNYKDHADLSCFKVYDAKVTKQWPLHFSLINLNASDEYDAITDGYHNCDANLTVLGLQP